MDERARDLGEAPIHCRIMIVVGSEALLAVGVGGGVKMEMAELSFVN